MPHDDFPHNRGGKLVFLQLLDIPFNRVDKFLKIFLGIGAFNKGTLDPQRELLPVIRLSPAVPLDNRQIQQFYLFVRGKPVLALEATAPSADGKPVCSYPRVQYSRVVVIADGTIHLNIAFIRTHNAGMRFLRPQALLLQTAILPPPYDARSLYHTLRVGV